MWLDIGFVWFPAFWEQLGRESGPTGDSGLRKDSNHSCSDFAGKEMLEV